MEVPYATAAQSLVDQCLIDDSCAICVGSTTASDGYASTAACVRAGTVCATQTSYGGPGAARRRGVRAGAHWSDYVAGRASHSGELRRWHKHGWFGGRSLRDGTDGGRGSRGGQRNQLGPGHVGADAFQRP